MSNVVVMFDEDALEDDLFLVRRLNERLYTFDLIKRATFIALVALLLFQLRRLATHILEGRFFRTGRENTIHGLALTVAAWVAARIILYFSLPRFIDEGLLYESINYPTADAPLIGKLLVALDMKMLVVAVLLWVAAVLMREGHRLKEENDLTV